MDHKNEKKNYKNKKCVYPKYCCPVWIVCQMYAFYHYEETSSHLFLSIWLSIWDTISQKP